MTFKIQDTEQGTLPFDLIDLLNCIGDEQKHYAWTLSFLDEYVLQPSVEESIVDFIYGLTLKENVPVSFEDLQRIGKNVLQIIDCEITGTSKNDKIVISAIDSSFWELVTVNTKIIERIKQRFKILEIHS